MVPFTPAGAQTRSDACRNIIAERARVYTRSRRPARLVYVEELPDKSAALKRERAIKALSHPKKQKLYLDPKTIEFRLLSDGPP